MTMWLSRCLVAVAWLGMTGCATVPPPAGPEAGGGSGGPDLNAELAQTEEALEQARQDQLQAERDLYQLRLNIRETALVLKTLKDHADSWDGELLTNRVALLLMEDSARTLRQRAEALIASAPVRETVAPPPAGEPEAPPAAPSAAPPQESAFKLITEGNHALQQGNLANAQALFEQARDQDPSLVGAQMGLAACAYQRDDLEEARRIVRAVLKADGAQPQALGLRSMLYWKSGQLKEALADAQRAVELDPRDAQLHKFRGIVLFSAQQPEEAVAAMRQAVQLDPADGEALMNMAIMLAQQPEADLAEAGTFYEAALKAGQPGEPQLQELLKRAKD